MLARKALTFLIPMLFAASPAPAAGGDARRWLTEQGYAAPAAGQVIACHGYGCARRQPVAVGGLLGRAGALLRQAGSPAAERQALAEITRLYTADLASRIGGRRDVPGSPPNLSGVHGQMDCLDVTANMLSLFVVLEEEGLLRFHATGGAQSRGVFFDGRYPHFTAFLTDRNGQRYAVDPWKRPPGERPEILPLDRWQQAAN